MANPWNNSFGQQQPVDRRTNIPGENQYWEARPNGITWTNAAGWASQSGIDPNTGALTGPGGLVPANYGLQFQAMHDQAVWNRQQTLIRQASAYGRGALGLLQSYRPGGGATIESNIYGQLGQMSLQQAQLTQPMDLLGDYRRHETAVARQQANRAHERQLAVQIGAIAAGVATAGIGGAAIGAGLAAGLGGYLGSRGQTTDPNQNYGDPGLSSQSTQSTQPIQAPAPMQGPTTTPSMTGPQSPMGGGGGGVALGAQAAPGATQAQAPGQQPQQQGQGQKSIQGQPGGQQQGAMGMGGPPPVGLDGNFSPQAYAVRGAHSLLNPIQQLAMARMAVNTIESDEVLNAFSYAIDQRLIARYRGVA